MTSLDADALRAALPGWARVDVVATTGSTNADLAAAADRFPDRTVLVAEHQHAGRGRLTRRWSSPPGSGLTFSVLLRPTGVPQARLGWLPLLAGLALVDAVRDLTGAPCGLKWPNDLLLGARPGKAAGILAEVADPVAPAVVVGIGINVAAAPPDEPGATCLAEHAGSTDRAAGSTDGAAGPTDAAAGRTDRAAGPTDRAAVLVAVLHRLAEREARWRAHAGDPDATRLRADYRAACLTLGSAVRVVLPGEGYVDGIAEDVDADGRLLLLDPSGRRRAVAAGDVTHVRAAP
ncbi:MAG: biotin--[acetyl-CoA-carboxylase] ligase [Pseudonocardia sp.]